MKHKLKSLLPISIAVALFYLYGTAGSLEVDSITIGQALVRGSITSVYLVLATVTYIIVGKEEERDGRESKSYYSCSKINGLRRDIN